MIVVTELFADLSENKTFSFTVNLNKNFPVCDIINDNDC